MQRKSRKTSSLLILGTLIFAGIIFILFSYYQSWLNVKFEQQVMENYTAYIESEGAQFSGAVVDIQDTLETLAALIPANNPNWDADTLTPMLADLTMRNTHFEIHSLTLSEAGLDEAQQNQLIQSGTLITAIENHPSGKAYFQVLAPLMRQNQLEAVLQAQVDITQLLSKSQSDRVSAPLNSWIILPEGSFIYTTSPSTSDYSNFYALLEGNHNPEATQMQIRNCLQAQTSGTFRVQTRKAGMLYVSLTPLDFNDWTLVNFIHANEASESSQMILLFTMRIGLFLILITAGIAYLFYALLNHQRRQINLEQRRYAFLSRFSDTLIFEYDVLKDTLELTSNAEKILPIKARSFTHVKKNHGLSLYIHAEDFYKLEEAFKTVHRFQEFGTVQLRIKTRDESYHWFTCQFQAVYERFHRDPVMIIGKLNDIQEQKYRERQLIEKSNYDGLTSVLNKKAAELQISEELGEGMSGCLFMIDLDDFKVINDELGHFIGDQVLTAIGVLLRTCFRQSDLIGRIGGDEFVVFLRSTDQGVIHQKVTQIMQTLPQLLHRQKINAVVTLSIGAALSRPSDTYPDLFSRADQAMYYAKQLGKNQFYLYSDSEDETS